MKNQNKKPRKQRKNKFMILLIAIILILAGIFVFIYIDKLTGFSIFASWSTPRVEVTRGMVLPDSNSQILKVKLTIQSNQKILGIKENFNGIANITFYNITLTNASDKYDVFYFNSKTKEFIIADRKKIIDDAVIEYDIDLSTSEPTDFSGNVSYFIGSNQVNQKIAGYVKHDNTAISVVKTGITGNVNPRPVNYKFTISNPNMGIYPVAYVYKQGETQAVAGGVKCKEGSKYCTTVNLCSSQICRIKSEGVFTISTAWTGNLSFTIMKANHQSQSQLFKL